MDPAHAPVVVGMDGSEASLAALRWAAGEALAHGAPLVAVYIFDPRERRVASYAAGGAPLVSEPDGVAALERLVSGTSPSDVECVYEVGVPSELLVRRAFGARMLVLGHADHHRLRDGEGLHSGTPLGPTARACVINATCPVVIVPIPAQRPTRCDVRMESEPQHAETTHRSPVIGARALRPVYQRIPIARG